MATATGTYATLAAVKTRAGITNTTDDALLQTLCDQVNQLIESPEMGTGKVLAPIASATYLFDGDGTRTLRVPMGVRAVTLLEIAPHTGGTYATIDPSDYFLRPLPQDRNGPNWPATKIVLSDYPAASSSYTVFYRGLSTVRVTMTAGWDAIPDDIAALAQVTVIRAWQARMAGQADVLGTDEYGKPIVSRFLSRPDRDLLLAYARELPGY